MKNTIAVASLLFLALFMPVAQGQTSHAFLWTATGGMQDLGTLGGDFSQAQGINASGQVVGYSYLADNITFHAFLWTASGGMQDLGAPAGANSVAMAINNAGQIAGYSSSPATSTDRIYHALLWTGGVMTNLGTLGGKSSDAMAINDAGVVTGASQAKSGGYRPMMWTATGGMRDLGTLGQPGGSGFGINASGEIVGISAIVNHLDEPYSWTSTGGMKDLLPRHNYTDGSASAINRSGTIAGWVNTTTNTYPALWTAKGLKVLPTLGGATGVMLAINDSNQAVGYSATASNANHGFLWTQAAGMTDLGTLGGTSSQALGINNAGQVVGYSDLP
jgi:probable HAF family extracellular repeat protein